MIQRKEFSLEVGGKTLTLEVSSLAGQANAAVLAKYGETAVLVTAVMTEHEATANYLPLKVDYEERFYAAGKIIGSRYVRREGRPSEEAILTGRLVDRTIRPLFDQRIRREIQVVVTVLAIDEENDPDFVGLMGASLALAISNIPWKGPVAAVRVAKVNGALVVNPNNSDLKNPGCLFETFVAGPAGRINMIELSGSEAQEEETIEAFALAEKEIARLTEFVSGIAKEIGKPKTDVPLFEPDPALRAMIEDYLKDRLAGALYVKSKTEQHTRLDALKKELFLKIGEEFSAKSGEGPSFRDAEFVFEEIIDRTVHENIIAHGRRTDDRAVDEVRQLTAETHLFDRTHGSALFVRGETQSLAVVTLAPPGQEQLIETMEVTGKRRFMLHYNFPAYSVGEVGPFRGPGRREIGHGALAEKALRPLIPPKEEFPYTIRIVSEILSSNGSSSMATVCASTMALMDAGVPLKKPVAGIAMGLMLEESQNSNLKSQNFKVLTDLQGPEDHYGDMDFKVAGTKDGVTAMQLDVKVHGLTMEIVKATLAQAKAARLQILDFVSGVIAAPRQELSPYVPTILNTKVPVDKIGMVIGPGGKMINGLIKKWALTSIDIDDDGGVFVSGPDPANARAALAEINALTKDFAVGEVVEGPVIKTLDFGAIVDLGGGRDGMIHVSELKNGFTKNVSEVVKVGDVVRAKVIRVEEGKIGLSLKQMTEAS